MIKKVFILFFILFSSCYAAKDFYHFNSIEKQQRFDNLTKQMRCLVCQNQTIADSNSGLAADLREQIYQQIEKGKSEKEIANYLVARYGNFILYNPPLTVTTLALWLGPFLILIGGLSFLFYYMRVKK